MAEKLSSDSLERQFGPTELEVLYQDEDENERIIATKAAKSGQVLELSRVTFLTPGTTAFPVVHRQVKEGMSMGKAFRANGVLFDRHVRGSGRYDAPDVFAGRFGSAGMPTVTDVLVRVGPAGMPYADILEVYSPEVAAWESGGQTDPKALAARVSAFGSALVALARPVYTEHA